MSEQDRIAFENWYISEHCKDLSEISINEVMAKTSLGDYSSFHVNGAYSGWQAATAEANKRINALESEVAGMYAELGKLTATPAESLQAHDDEVIERCANAIDEMVTVYTNNCDKYKAIGDKESTERNVNKGRAAISCAEVIRALKGKVWND